MTYSISESHARWFQCTAEHLLAASEGGPLSPDNIVAACKFCNWTRHKSKRPLSPAVYKRQVLRRLELGKWNRLLFSATTLGNTESRRCKK
ncbi:HNH endonuclease [Ruegeria arenilitoris]